MKPSADDDDLFRDPSVPRVPAAARVDAIQRYNAAAKNLRATAAVMPLLTTKEREALAACIPINIAGGAVVGIFIDEAVARYWNAHPKEWKADQDKERRSYEAMGIPWPGREETRTR